MRPKSESGDAFSLFQAHFDQQLNLRHPLIQLAKKIDWLRFEAAFVDCYAPEMGAPAKATRLMAGLHYLKYQFQNANADGRSFSESNSKSTSGRKSANTNNNW